VRAIIDNNRIEARFLKVKAKLLILYRYNPKEEYSVVLLYIDKPRSRDIKLDAEDLIGLLTYLFSNESQRGA